MDILSWLWWVISSSLLLIWQLIWFLISGWVSTLLQILLLVAVIFFLKYGWQRAPIEIWNRGSAFAKFVWSWIRTREPQMSTPTKTIEKVRVVHVKNAGDVNVSTLLTISMLAGLVFLAQMLAS